MQYTLAEWIDVSVPLRPGMVHWPDNPPFEITQIHDMERGDQNNLSHVSMGIHTGTHMDAPLHFVNRGASIDAMPLTATVGLARVIEIESTVSIDAPELERNQIEAGERILFRTVNSTRCWTTDSFVEDFVYISQAGARFLAHRKVLSVGVDYLSVGGYHKDGLETHQALLGAGIWVIEGLDLSSVPGGHYDLICLPLRLVGAEGSPARAILRKAGFGLSSA